MLRRSIKVGTRQFKALPADAVTAFPVHETLVYYALNLLGKHRLTSQLLLFLVVRLDGAGREELERELERIKALWIKRNGGKRSSGKRKSALAGRQASPHPVEQELPEPAETFRDDEGETSEFDDLDYLRVRTDSGRDAYRIAEKISAGLNASRLTEARVEKLFAGRLRRALGGEVKQPLSVDIPVLEELSRTFELSQAEAAFLCFAYCYTQSTTFESFVDSHGTSDWITLVSVATGCRVGQIRKLFEPSGRLMSTGLIERQVGYERTSYVPAIEVSDHLSGLSADRLIEKFCKKHEGPTLPLDSFRFSQRCLDVATNLVSGESGGHLLLTGAPGTGKTEFARAIAAAVGKSALFVRQGMEGRGGRRLALHAAAASASSSSSVVIVDEADALLNTESCGFFELPDGHEKGWVNDFMDRAKCLTIWITNGIDCVPESTLRRFSYSLSFPDFSSKQRRRVFDSSVAGTSLEGQIDAVTISRLASAYKVNASGVAMCVTRTQEFVSRGRVLPGAALPVLEELLGRHQMLISKGVARQVQAPVGQYDLAALNIDADPKLVMSSLERFTDSASWAGGSPGQNLLFWGHPGTGKTECARYLASELGLQLVVRSAAQLLNCYVGQTEKLIQQAFDEARDEQAILFIDEADTFLCMRERAHHSWEVSFTNQFLACMESHPGILVCCTNLLDNLDRAAMRRFHWKVEFRSIRPQDRVRVYGKYFSLASGPIGPVEARGLEAIPDLNFGDFRAVFERIRFSDPSTLSHVDIVAMLEKECTYRSDGRGKKIGFDG